MLVEISSDLFVDINLIQGLSLGDGAMTVVASNGNTWTVNPCSKQRFSATVQRVNGMLKKRESS